MIQTLEATIDEKGGVRLLEPIQLNAPRRVLVTILEQPASDKEDLAAAYRDMAHDEARESEALEWAEATVGNAS